MSLPLSFIYDPKYLRHDTGEDHPETPERLEAMVDFLRKSDLFTSQNCFEPQVPERRWLTAVHPEEYLFRFEETVLSGRSWLGHRDNQLCYETYDIALLAAGAGLTAITLLEEKKCSSPFCLVRPPGHHAEPTVPLGFCFLNNCAIAARYWQRCYNLERVVIIDFDAHHGNGIQEIFEEDRSVFYISIHEHPTFSFPGTGYQEEKGAGDGEGYTLNLPLPPASDGAMVRKLFVEGIEPVVKSYQPQAIIVAAGFDGHRDDDMSGLAYDDELYGFLACRLRGLADKYCEGKILSMLEGGYNLPSLCSGVHQYCLGLSGQRGE